MSVNIHVFSVTDITETHGSLKLCMATSGRDNGCQSLWHFIHQFTARFVQVAFYLVITRANIQNGIDETGYASECYFTQHLLSNGPQCLYRVEIG